MRRAHGDIPAALTAYQAHAYCKFAPLRRPGVRAVLFCTLKTLARIDIFIPRTPPPPRIVSTVVGRHMATRSEGRLGAYVYAVTGRRLAGDITVTACPDVGAEAGRMHVAFLLNVRGAFTAGYPFNYISQTPISTS
ncbi:hypothetical protein C8R44DRAFT_988233 [Mycena epipterygia]|nr:hypothetical protein C8R44DRAFT_988233 [Mycena epipterygia]